MPPFNKWGLFQQVEDKRCFNKYKEIFGDCVGVLSTVGNAGVERPVFLRKQNETHNYSLDSTNRMPFPIYKKNNHERYSVSSCYKNRYEYPLSKMTCQYRKYYISKAMLLFNKRI